MSKNVIKESSKYTAIKEVVFFLSIAKNQFLLVKLVVRTYFLLKPIRLWKIAILSEISAGSVRRKWFSFFLQENEFKIYSEYCTNYDNAEAYLKQKLKKKKDLENLLNVSLWFLKFFSVIVLVVIVCHE